MRLSSLRDKEVINMKDCKCLGNVCDLEFDCKTGCVLALIVPGPSRFCFFGYDCEYIIPWRCVCQIGPDVILVDIDSEKDKHKL